MSQRTFYFHECISVLKCSDSTPKHPPFRLCLTFAPVINNKNMALSGLSLIETDADNTSNSLLTAGGSADTGVETPEGTLTAGRDDGRVTVDSDEEVMLFRLLVYKTVPRFSPTHIARQEASRSSRPSGVRHQCFH